MEDNKEKSLEKLSKKELISMISTLKEANKSLQDRLDKRKEISDAIVRGFRELIPQRKIDELASGLTINDMLRDFDFSDFSNVVMKDGSKVASEEDIVNKINENCKIQSEALKLHEEINRMKSIKDSFIMNYLQFNIPDIDPFSSTKEEIELTQRALEKYYRDVYMFKTGAKSILRIVPDRTFKKLMKQNRDLVDIWKD